MGNKSKRANKGLTLKQQEQLMQDLTDMVAVVLAYKDYCKSIGKEKEALEYTQKWMQTAAQKIKDEKVS